MPCQTFINHKLIGKWLFIILWISSCVGANNSSFSGCRIRPDEDFVNCSAVGLSSTFSISIPSRTRVIILDSNDISTLNSDTLFPKSNLSHVEILSLGYNNLSLIESGALLRLPVLSNLRLDHNSITVIPVDFFRNNSQLKKLNLARNPLNIRSTAESLQSLTNLYRLDLSGSLNGIDALPDLFANLTGLNELILRDLSLSNLTADFFGPLAHLPLRHLDLAGSVIGVVDEETFTPVKDVEELILANVTIEAEQLEKLLSGLKNGSVQAINLNDVFVFSGHEYIITAETLGNLEGTKLRRLYFRGNYAGMHGRIHGKQFHTLKGLQELYLDRCDIRSVHGESFRGLHHLKILSLSRNLISCTGESDCRFLTSGVQLKALHTLDFTNNLLSEADNALTFLETTFPQLVHLNLSWNRISSITSGMFGKLDNLLTLDLSDNPIREIYPDALNGLSSLRKIELKNCQFLNRIRGGVFNELSNLKVINLQNSALVHIHHGAFNHLVHLEKLYLRSNRLWESGDAIKKIALRKSNLRVLDLGGNNLNYIPSGLIENSHKLKFLSLDNNYISDCNELLLLSTSALEFLDISSNSFVQPSVECFEKLHNLQMINASGNPFYCSCEIRDFINWLNGPSVTVEQRSRHVCAAPQDYAGVNLLEAQFSGWECRGRVALMATMAICAAIALAIGAVWVVYSLLCKRQAECTSNGQGHSSTPHGNPIHISNRDISSVSTSRYLPLDEEDAKSTEVILNGDLLDRDHRRRNGIERRGYSDSTEVPVVPLRRSRPNGGRSGGDVHYYNGSVHQRDLSIRLIGDDVDNDEISVTSSAEQYVRIEANMEDAV